MVMLLATDTSVESARRTVRDRQVTIPAGTVLRVRLAQSIGSDLSHVEDTVRGSLASPVTIGGRTILPTGTPALGIVTDAERSGRVKGRGRVAVRFHQLTADGERYSIRTRPWVASAPGTKKRDLATIAVPAAGGAVIGAIADGKKGAGIGAAIGGGAGTGVVLATRGKEVRLSRGRVLAVRLISPVTLSIR